MRPKPWREVHGRAVVCRAKLAKLKLGAPTRAAFGTATVSDGCPTEGQPSETLRGTEVWGTGVSSSLGPALRSRHHKAKGLARLSEASVSPARAGAPICG